MPLISRRSFVACACCASLGSFAALNGGSWRAYAASGAHTDLTPDQALALLKEGNRSFTTDAPFRRESTDRDRRIEIARGQTDRRVNRHTLVRRHVSSAEPAAQGTQLSNVFSDTQIHL
ncbi:hypothetical protein [Methylobacterium nigriterrae]|uniref:hypothetical protein n=1 Tax=Methylobacterium nigriterrae TaxID=3127512 RepID=UPI003013BCD6